MGSLGFLGEWNFADHKRAFQEVYSSSLPKSSDERTSVTPQCRVFLRSRLKVALYDSGLDPNSRSLGMPPDTPEPTVTHSLNEIVLHRGALPHLAQISIFAFNQYLTNAIADGLIISTPTGSTAYSLSAGGSIIHPLVSSLLLTPICPRSLSFRPLVLPGTIPISLRLGKSNRSSGLAISVDGVRQGRLRIGSELRIRGEEIIIGDDGWRGGVPTLIGEESSWMGRLNKLLKFNRSFGEEEIFPDSHDIEKEDSSTPA